MSDKNSDSAGDSSLRARLIGLPRPIKQLLAVGTDIVGFTICACATEWLLFDTVAVSYLSTFLMCFVVAIFANVFAWTQGLYRSIVRYMGFDLFVAGAKTAAGSAVIGSALMFFSGMTMTPFRWATAFWGSAFIYVYSSRYLARVFLIKRRARVERERVIIYGAGSAGAQLALGLLGGDEFIPMAMIDSDEALHDKMVQGLVVHSPEAIGRLIGDTNATRVLLAIPSASRRKRRTVLEHLSSFPVHVQTMPGLTDLVSGLARVDDIQDVDVKDLLDRDPVPPNMDLLGASITGKNVMITGAGGSIGSELCRQIIRLNPSTVILFELSEFALYDIEKELHAISATLEKPCTVMAFLGSVHHKERVQQIMATFDINTIYHAAAYKHVPLVEQNILEGVHNNVIGTLYLAEAAIAAKVETFVLISTDKAVSPTNIMGATKRFAELILQALQDKHGGTRFSMVRFGNVLESSGSVVPLFREQIRSGGPVTVTHRDIFRYFMTIPEAAQLVIQSAAMARGGDVFVLDMGEPVRILDLALRMIKLMGLTVRDEENPDGDIEIKFTGLRPAEKLFEELLIGTDVSGTDHPQILRANEEKMSLRTLEALIDDLQINLLSQDCDSTRNILLRAISGYNPTNGIDDLVWVNRKKTGTEDRAFSVVSFPRLKS